MKYEIFREMPVGTMFELSGLKFKKVEHDQRPDGEGYYNALQLDIKDGYAWVKEDNLFRVVTQEDIEAEKRWIEKKKKKRRRRKPNAKKGGDPDGSGKPSNNKGSSQRKSSKHRSSKRRSPNNQNRSNPNKS
ncbi:MAG: hypothetical protein JXB38_14495 [Anaerolineales bacterium]|nr:hypothetical protein [Anaerolineales bacterium]